MINKTLAIGLCLSGIVIIVSIAKIWEGSTLGLSFILIPLGMLIAFACIKLLEYK